MSPDFGYKTSPTIKAVKNNFSQHIKEFGLNIYAVDLILQFYQILIYALLIKLYQQTIKENQKRARIIMVSFSMYALGNICYYLLVWTNRLNPDYDYIISFFMAISIYSIGYYSQRREIENPKNKTEEKYANSLLSESLKQAMTKRFSELIDHDEIHLMHDINLEYLSQKLNASKHDTSQLINNQ